MTPTHVPTLFSSSSQSWLLLLSTVLIVMTGCQKNQTQTVAQPSTGQAAPIPANATRQDDIKAVLLQTAQAKKSVAEGKFCNLVVFADRPEKIQDSSFQDEMYHYQEAVEKGYFTASGQGSGMVKMTPTPKFLALLQHGRIDESGLYTTFCYGKTKITDLTSIRQANPTKYTAGGVMTLQPEEWATPEVVRLFGPSRNDPVYVPRSLVFYKEGDTWEVERR